MNIENTKASSYGAFAPEPRVYELGYLLMPSVDEGNLEQERDALVALITRFKGIVIDEGQPVLIDLAYDMDKTINNKKHSYSQAYFGWIKFETSPRGVQELDIEIEKLENIIRYILVKTVKEHTIVSEQPFKLAKNAKDIDEDEEDYQDHTQNQSTDTDVVSEGDLSEDDLTKIEGIGPVIAKTLSQAGISSFSLLASSDNESIQNIIKDVRGNHDSGTWPQQATLASEAKWDELKELQEGLDGGVEKE